MWMMLQQDTPDDYVVATGEAHSVRDFLMWPEQRWTRLGEVCGDRSAVFPADRGGLSDGQSLESVDSLRLEA